MKTVEEERSLFMSQIDFLGEIVWKKLHYELKVDAEFFKQRGMEDGALIEPEVLFKLAVELGFKIARYEFSYPLSSLVNFNSPAFEKVDSSSLIHPEYLERIKGVQQNIPFEGEGVILLGSKGTNVVLPFSTEIFLDQIIPIFLEVIKKNDPLIRSEYKNIEAELKLRLIENYPLDYIIAEDRFIKWFLKISRECIIDSVCMTVSNSASMYTHWGITIHNLTPELAEKHVLDYCEYRKTQRDLESNQRKSDSYQNEKDFPPLIGKALAFFLYRVNKAHPFLPDNITYKNNFERFNNYADVIRSSKFKYKIPKRFQLYWNSAKRGELLINDEEYEAVIKALNYFEYKQLASIIAIEQRNARNTP